MEDRICKECGGHFEVEGDRFSRFCSRVCRNKFRNRQNNLDNKIKKVCKTCGKSFECYRSEVYKNYCRSKCKRIGERDKESKYDKKKVENKIVNGSRFLNREINIILVDKSDKNIGKEIRHTNKMKIWRKAVFKRDNYTCQHCGEASKSGRYLHLNAHHIIPMAELIASYTNIEEKFRDDSYSVINDDFFYDLTNAIVLCETCHKEWHDNQVLERIWQERILLT